MDVYVAAKADLVGELLTRARAERAASRDVLGAGTALPGAGAGSAVSAKDGPARREQETTPA